MAQQAAAYKVGIMKTPVETTEHDAFYRLVDEALASIENVLVQDLNLALDIFEFNGPHLSPTAGTYAPLDFLQMGVAEKLERRIHFLLIITEVELSATTFSYVLALPSQLTNVGLISTRRLQPGFWGEARDDAITISRLATLMLHTIGHLLNVPHAEAPDNVMYDFTSPEELGRMNELTAEQVARIKRTLPREAREEIATRGGHLFALRQIARNGRAIIHHVLRANPLRLIAEMPTMVTAALSVAVALFFSAEVWDVGASIESWQLLFFSFTSVLAATLVLYRAFSFGTLVDRNRMISESTVVTETVVFASLLLTMVAVYVAFFLFFLLGATTIFPRELMSTWITGSDPATELRDHAKVAMFLATMAVLVGSLGGRADSKELIRSVLFLDEES